MPKAKKAARLYSEQQTMGPEWSYDSEGGRIVKTTPTEAQQSETIAQAANVIKVTP